MTAAHLNVSTVQHSYKRGQPAVLTDISFEVTPGEVVALVGRSGCGKSTLLHIMAGLLTPSAGEVHIDGLAIHQPSPKWVMMFQKPSLYPWMSVAQNVALGLRFTGRAKEAAQKVPELLELVELSDFADRNVQDLSGGQQQRVALARSLAPRPEVLFLDEPFSALDAFTRTNLQRDVRRIAKELDITVVLVTHDLAEAVIMAERAIVLSADPGRISDVVPIALADRDDLRSADYVAARGKLNTAYEKAAGLALAGDAAGASAQATSRATPRHPSTVAQKQSVAL